MTATDTRSEFGARFDDTTIVNGMPLALRARVAWASDPQWTAPDYRKRPMQIIRLEFGIAIRSIAAKCMRINGDENGHAYA